MDLNRTRRARSQTSLQHLFAQVGQWIEMRTAADARRQHATQLRAISALINHLRLRLERDLQQLPGDDVAYALYGAAAQLDRRTVWVERLWSYFRTRFDQRDNPELAATLAAADEIVWSCYRPVLDRARTLGIPTGPTMPPPLCFLEPRYSPEAFPAELVPPDLKSEIEGEFVRTCLNRMPITVVRIPPVCVIAPWWLTLLGHEVGHQIQYDLLPEKRLVEEFATLLAHAATQATGSASEGTTWAGWSEEIFADLCSVLRFGPWALRAMLELELTTKERMHDPRGRYPSPATRLRLLARATDHVTGEGSGTKMLRQIPDLADRDPVVESVLKTALGTLPVLGVKLSDLCVFDANSFLVDVPSWSASFQARRLRTPAPSVRAAPVLVSSAFHAWDEMAAADNPRALQEFQTDLAERCTTAIRAGAPDGERAGDASVTASDKLLDELANAFLRAKYEEIPCDSASKSDG